jgi:broad specificity phosphatase PhoE
MKKVWWVRHGESVSNAGGRVSSVASVALTEKGQEQAQQFAADLADAPPLVIYSAYVRTRQTAAPTLARFPQTPHEEWPMHEYSFLPAAAYEGTTEAERQPATQAYWAAQDPHLRLGLGSESFVDFIGRIDTALTQLAQRPEPFIVVFNHGFFMRGVIWRLLTPQSPEDPVMLNSFRAFTEFFPTPNTVILPTFHTTENGWLLGRMQGRAVTR